MKKIFPENYLYWVDKGLSEDDAKIKAKEMSGVRYAGNKKYYLHRDPTLSEIEAERLANEWKLNNCQLGKAYKLKNKFNGDEGAYNEWKQSVCNLSKQNLLKTMSLEEYTEHKKNLGKKLDGKRPNTVAYWVSKGFTLEEAKIKVHEHSILHSKRRVEYWLSRGYSLEEAINFVSKHQNNTSLDKFIERHGKDEGVLKYNLLNYKLKLSSTRSYLHWINLGYSEEEAKKIVSNIQSQYSQLQPKLPTYWINLGYTEIEAMLKCKEFASRLSHWSVNYWLDKGFSENEAKEKVRFIQKENSLKGIQSYNHNGRLISSKLENKVVEYFIEKKLNIITDYVINDVENKTVYFPDLVFDNFILEVYGDYWHANPKKYKENDKLNKTFMAKDKWERDAKRIERIKTITKLPVFIWWESDILEFGIENLYLKIFEELKNENN